LAEEALPPVIDHLAAHWADDAFEGIKEALLRG
jgi:hypothetical protein